MRLPIFLFLQIYCFSQALGRRDDYRAAHHKNFSCEMGSCYPATGNLLIGREKYLTASSTCGLLKRERYCIVSHIHPKKCFICESNQGKTEQDLLSRHGIENIIYSHYPGTNISSWWQSENGKENVSIRLDLEAEFHFTHLIIKFGTFRPRAMLIERSSDKGVTWKVYSYFAENCEEAFPGIPRYPPKSLSDVICDSRYSGLEPSSNGEVILRVISPNLQGLYLDPYSPELQGLLKMTNLRINFTKLRTLGDDLVDTRDEIKEKYYYAVKEMIVRGSCWCYGHAQSCLPVEGVEGRQDMVHGRCNCTHNTKGLNCQKCADFYNDVPWAPAIGRKANACRACNCNNHSYKCKFNEDVYIKSGRISGGVCQNCKHNTKGKNCEECSDFFYLDPYKDITEPDACIPCECNLDGSADGGLCDSKTDVANSLEAGRCHCKTNVFGKNCNNCKPGFWDFNPNNIDGCRACTCNIEGTVNGSNICDVITGECECKPNVTGKDCNQCLPEHYGLSANTDGCKPCDCVPGGSLYSECDVISGDCKCRPNIIGRRCDKPNQGYFIPTPVNVYEAELAECFVGECRIEVREPLKDTVTPWTGPGFMRVYDNTALKFNISDIRRSNEYDVIIRYEPQYHDDWAQVEISLEREDSINTNDVCANTRIQDDSSATSLTPDSRYAVGATLCLEKDKRYNLILQFKSEGNNQVDSPTASILIDSITLIPAVESLPIYKGSGINEIRKHEYERNMCKELLYEPVDQSDHDSCAVHHYSISAIIHGEAYECNCDPTGSLSSMCNPEGGKCECKPNVVGRTCDRCAPGTRRIDTQGCIACDCDSVGALNNICNETTGQCHCREGTYGRTCGDCEPGSWNFPNCVACECNGHAHTCTSSTGECINCQDATTGHFCERCQEGFYGDPRIGSGIQCKACKCPNTIESGHSFAPRCVLNPVTQDVVCECEEGYTGPRCDMCADNYYGNPEEVGGSCKPCECSDNVDLLQPGNCDRHTGECLKCLHHTHGFNCEHCIPGYYGDAKTKTCQDCACNILGTNTTAGLCDPISGACHCLPNVIGRDCSECKPNYWKIGLGIGCEECNCDMTGSNSTLCNPFNGECECKEGFGGRQCNHCKKYFYGDPNKECFSCKCNLEGSEHLECNQENGTCFCKTGIGGDHCDECARGWYGKFPNCTRCGECFDNWDRIISVLQLKTNEVIKSAGEINRNGTTGAYKSEFGAMTEKIDYVKNALNSTKINNESLGKLSNTTDKLRNMLNNSTVKVSSHSEKVNNMLTNIYYANFSLQNVHEQVKKLKNAASLLNNNATKLQEKYLTGALDLTRGAGITSNEVNSIESNTKKLLQDADRYCKRTEGLLHEENSTFTEIERKNEQKRGNIEFDLSRLEAQIPVLNTKVCDGNTDIKNECDQFCGGANCNRCGGINCKLGAVGKASAGLGFAKHTEKNINDHLRDAEKTYRMIQQARQETENANRAAKNAHDEAFRIKSDYELLVKNMTEVSTEMNEYVNTPAADPADIRKIASEILNYSIPYEPEKIKNLTRSINAKIASLKNINNILQETKDDQVKAKTYKEKSKQAKFDADVIKRKVEMVVQSLKNTNSSQQNVYDIIQRTNDSIGESKKDLTQVSSEITSAEQKANDSQNEVQNLQGLLKNLQTRVLKNEHDAKQASKEGKRVKEQVRAADRNANTLIARYNEVNEDLKNKSRIYDLSKSRALKLFEKAQILSGTAKTKLKELKDLSVVYEEQERNLLEFAEEIKDLLQQINDYSNTINARSEYYRVCPG